MNPLGPSWKTSVLGWSGLVAAVAMAVSAVIGGEITSHDWSGLWESIILVFPSLAAIFARDNTVSSEEAGAGWEVEEDSEES